MYLTAKRIVSSLVLSGVLLTQASATETSCNNPEGVYAMMASLATNAMSDVGRLQPLTDFKVENWKLVLSPEGLSRCPDGCQNTKAILSMQEPEINNYVSTSVFNSSIFRERLITFYQRQETASTRPATDPNRAYAEAHSLNLFEVVQYQSCGTHYGYTIQAADSTFEKKEQLCTQLIWVGAQGTVSTDRCIAENPFLDVRFNTVNNQSLVYVDPLSSIVKGEVDDGVSVVNSCIFIDASNSSNNRACGCENKTGKLKKINALESTYYCNVN